MIDTVYIESGVRGHPRSRRLLKRLCGATTVPIERYGSVFNVKAQNFRLQKRRPALILAAKHGQWVLPTPPAYGIGHTHNYYFSHLLNCPYDCRYCFLQGMFTSANYVLFVDYENCVKAIRDIAVGHGAETCCFFSGYDGDSLALEPMTGFVEHLLPHFRHLANAWLELRTKSVQIRQLLAMDAIPNCVVAFSLAPQAVVDALENGTPNLVQRLGALARLQNHGWTVGLRFDPLIQHQGFRENYMKLFAAIEQFLDIDRIHSATLGAFRLPQTYFERLSRLFPAESLFASALSAEKGLVSYSAAARADMLEFCRQRLAQSLPGDKIFVHQ